MAINTCTFTGNLGRDPELKTLPNGTAVLNFSIAATAGFGDKKNTFWIWCAMFGKRAEAMAKFLSKGQMVAVSGELNLRTYDTRDGSKGSSLELSVRELQIMSARDANAEHDASARQNKARPSAPPQPNDGFTEDDDGELPF